MQRYRKYEGRPLRHSAKHTRACGLLASYASAHSHRFTYLPPSVISTALNSVPNRQRAHSCVTSCLSSSVRLLCSHAIRPFSSSSSTVPSETGPRAHTWMGSVRSVQVSERQEIGRERGWEFSRSADMHVLARVRVRELSPSTGFPSETGPRAHTCMMEMDARASEQEARGWNPKSLACFKMDRCARTCARTGRRYSRPRLLNS